MFKYIVKMDMINFDQRVKCVVISQTKKLHVCPSVSRVLSDSGVNTFQCRPDAAGKTLGRKQAFIPNKWKPI